MAPGPRDAPLRGRVLLVDDEPGLLRSLERALRSGGTAVETAASGELALALLADRDFDAMVLDLGLPGIDGVEVCRRLRAAGDRIPILVLTARDGIGDRVEGLDAGADDYLVKPFALAELRARLRALLRRLDETRLVPAELTFDDVVLDTAAMIATRAGHDLCLSKTEWRLLEAFMRRPGQALSRSLIYQSVWGYDMGETSNTLGVYIGYLRRKLEAHGGSRLIQTIHGHGYSLRRP